MSETHEIPVPDTAGPIPGGLRTLRSTVLVFDGLFIVGLIVLMSLYWSPRDLSSDSMLTIVFYFMVIGLIFVAFSLPYLATNLIYLIQWMRKIEGKGYRVAPATTVLKIIAPILVIGFDVWSLTTLFGR